MGIFTQDDTYRKLEKPVQQSDKKPPKKGIWGKPTLKGIITSFFGRRNKPNEKASSDHKGIDIGVSVGTPVMATQSGKVLYTAYEGFKKGYGRFVVLDHGNGLTSWYGHLNDWVVKPGQTVAKGQLIAHSGNTGNSTGAHLHFGIKQGNNWLNPTDYIGTY